MDIREAEGRNSQNIFMFNSVNDWFISTTPYLVTVGAVERLTKMFLVSFVLFLLSLNEEDDAS